MREAHWAQLRKHCHLWIYEIHRPLLGKACFEECSNNQHSKAKKSGGSTHSAPLPQGSVVSPMNVVNSTASRVLPRIGPSGGREELKDPVVGDVRFSPLLHRPSLRED